MTILKAEYDKKISELQLQCKEDITKIDMLRKEALAKADSQKVKYQKAMGQLNELKEVLQMAADADTRKDALVEEVRASAKEAKERLEKERELLEIERESVEAMKREARESGLANKRKIEELEYQKRESQTRIEQLSLFLADKTKTVELQIREIESLKR